MKKLLLILLFIPVLLFSQVQQVNVRNERNLSLSPEKIKVRTPISVDLYNYTHIAIVDVDISNPGYPKKQWTNVYADRLKQSPLTILNPYSYQVFWEYLCRRPERCDAYLSNHCSYVLINTKRLITNRTLFFLHII